jgi:predicted HicB family RNase H-like nuclease
MAEAKSSVMKEMRQLSLVPLKKATFRIPADLHRQLKVLAAQQDREMTDLIVEAIRRYLES